MPEFDLGDVAIQFGVRVKGLRTPQVRWKIGVPVDSTEAERARGSQRVAPYEGRVDLVMDLQSDKKVALEIQFTDENGNAVSKPEDATVTYTGDNADVLTVNDNGDGTAEVVPVGPLGTANVHADIQTGGKTLTGDMQVNVVAGLAERVNIVAGEPTEVTPDE